MKEDERIRCYCFFKSNFSIIQCQMQMDTTQNSLTLGKKILPSCWDHSQQTDPSCQVLHSLHLLLRTPLTNTPFFPQQHISGIKAWPFLLNSANLAVFTPELPAEMTEWSGHHSFSPHVHPVSSLFSSQTLICNKRFI